MWSLIIWVDCDLNVWRPAEVLPWKTGETSLHLSIPRQEWWRGPVMVAQGLWLQWVPTFYPLTKNNNIQSPRWNLPQLKPWIGWGGSSLEGHSSPWRNKALTACVPPGHFSKLTAHNFYPLPTTCTNPCSSPPFKGKLEMWGKLPIAEEQYEQTDVRGERIQRAGGYLIGY